MKSKRTSKNRVDLEAHQEVDLEELEGDLGDGDGDVEQEGLFFASEAYVQQLEASRLKLLHLEQEFEQTKAQFITDVIKFISGCMASLSAMVQLELPHLLEPRASDSHGELNQRMGPQFQKLNKALIELIDHPVVGMGMP
ncbi:hypothetical protein L1987_42296 [Smallanthus sonchifolius]|uniref:Uncharacterized protein n=1 Tax=Smallanthus sonchifolius TaxID=185202 RepID=A0ACB9GWB7_9ASTR|nr:hypothetical protein L1987_42296 [Smallanthus sonchifolius]